MDDQVKAFMSVRPSRKLDDVQYIANFCDGKGIPFCWECADWHELGEVHSTT